jgi:hypothetical protein
MKKDGNCAGVQRRTYFAVGCRAIPTAPTATASASNSPGQFYYRNSAPGRIPTSFFTGKNYQILHPPTNHHHDLDHFYPSFQYPYSHILKKINFVLLVSRQGKTRLAKWFTTLSPKEKSKIVKDVTQLVLARRTKMCNFLEYKGKHRSLVRARVVVFSISNAGY